MVLYSLVKRNIKLFFRDRMNVFFSLLSVMIIIGLYILFLGDAIYSGMKKDVGTEGLRFLIDSWIMAGMLSVASMTITLGAYGAMVEDKAKKINKDFLSSPIKRNVIAAGYIVSSFVIGLIMSLLSLVFAEIYILSNGGSLLTFAELIKVFSIIFLSVMASSAMIFLLVSFLKTVNSYSTASTIIGTLIGFVTGVYMPIGNLPAAVGTVVKLFPISHSAALFRQVMMERAMNATLKGAPAQMVESFKLDMGVVFKIRGYEITPLMSILFLLATIIVFYAIAIIRLTRKSK